MTRHDRGVCGCNGRRVARGSARQQGRRRPQKEAGPMRDIRDAQMVGRTSDGRLVQRPLVRHLHGLLDFDMIDVGRPPRHRLRHRGRHHRAGVVPGGRGQPARRPMPTCRGSCARRSAICPVRLDRGAVVSFLRRHPPPDLGHRAGCTSCPRCDRSRVVILGATAVLTLLTWLIALL